jgi:threonine dehydrogenase-like Zn-dependent dehydrogenase
VRVETVPDPKILNRRDAIVKITSTATCGSDLHLYNHFIPTMEEGDILGHEFMGEIVEVGPDVRDRKVGDRVVTAFPVALREAIMACRNGGVVSVIGVYGGLIDKFPMGSFMNRSLTMRTGQCHVQRYWKKLLEHIEKGDIDPSFVITHPMALGEAPHGYDIFNNKEDNCIKIVLKP